MRNIKKAKEIKKLLLHSFTQTYPDLGATGKVIFKDNDLAIEITLKRHSKMVWVKEHEGFPIIVKQPSA